jgi:signal transduction histidine kinase
VAGLVALAYLRSVLCGVFHRHRNRLAPFVWASLVLALNAAIGLSWAAFAYLAAEPDVPWQMIAMALLALGASWTALAHATWLPALIAMPILSIGPIVGLIWAQPEPGSIWLGLLILCVMLASIFNALATGQQVIAAERLARRNQDLSHRLIIERDRAQAGNRAKTTFLATMGHELKTPLNAMIGFAEIISLEQHVSLPEVYRGYLTDIIASGRHLVEVVNDVLSMARLESGHHKLVIQSTDVTDLAHSVLRLMRVDAQAARIGLSLEAPESLTIDADPRALRQILFNLISNAIKFSPPGSKVTVRLGINQEGARIEVLDQGAGIAPEDFDRVLRPFEQADESMARRHGGIGLGLPISLALVELHGGRLEIQSTVGEGTRMIVTLPIHHIAEAAEKSTPPEWSAGS